jgi:hypothetical protein
MPQLNQVTHFSQFFRLCLFYFAVYVFLLSYFCLELVVFKKYGIKAITYVEHLHSL